MYSPSEATSHMRQLKLNTKIQILSGQLNTKKNIAQLRKNLPEMQETWVPSLGQEDLLEKEMATHSNILAWKILWTEESGGVQSMGLQESDTT